MKDLKKYLVSFKGYDNSYIITADKVITLQHDLENHVVKFVQEFTEVTFTNIDEVEEYDHWSIT